MSNSDGLMPSLKHIDEQFRELVTACDTKKLDHLNAEWFVPNPRSQSIIDAIRSLLFMPPRKPPMNLVISGPSGCGKSTSIKQLTNTLAQSYVDDYSAQTPAIVVNVPQVLDEKSLLTSFIQDMAPSYDDGYSIDELRGYADKLLNSLHVKVIIVEMTNRFVGAPGSEIESVLTAIDMMATRAGASIVLVVTPDVEKLIIANGAQSFSANNIYVDCFDNDDSFRDLLADFESLLPLPEPSLLDDHARSGVIHMLTNGNLSIIKELLVKSASIAINYGDRSLNDGHIYAYATQRAVINPFSMS